MSGLVRLADADASAGAKAATLGRLVRAGFAVPDGVVVRDATAEGWPAALADLLGELGGLRFAVRSSAAGEDSAAASFAGQLLTMLDVPAPDVAAAVREVAASGPQAAAYANATGRDGVGQVAALVQPMLDPRAAGVAFTRHPVTGAATPVVEAVRGLGEGLVAGNVTPERWQAGDRLAGPPDVLLPGDAEKVVRLAEQVKQLLSEDQDVEWAIDEDDTIWILQARPLTAVGTGTSNETPPDPRQLLSGTPASPGRASGPVRVVLGLDDFADFQDGDVLACTATSPAWTPVLARAAAVITEVGGILSHTAIVARELGIPAVTDVPAATTLAAGSLVTVDGTHGTVAAREVS